MKKSSTLVIFIALAVTVTGCSFHYTYYRNKITYNSKVKSILIKDKSCELEVDPPQLGTGKVKDVKISHCLKLSVGDDVTIQELTINSKHTAKALKGIYLGTDLPD